MNTNAGTTAHKPPKPTRLNFRLEDGRLVGDDPDNGVSYRISWCGNGAYSHYSLDRLDAPGVGWYIYADRFERSDKLYQAIYTAEMLHIYGVEVRPLKRSDGLKQLIARQADEVRRIEQRLVNAKQELARLQALCAKAEAEGD